MKNHTNTRLVIYSGLALALALGLWSTVQAQTAKPAQEKGMMEKGMMEKGKQGPGMMERCQEMMEQKQKMKAELKAQDARLTEQVAAMNRAPADKKTDLMAGIVTLMVEQRITRDELKAKMEEKMMEHMMEHMQRSMQMNTDSMSQCPMMKGMMGDKSAEAPNGAQQ